MLIWVSLKYTLTFRHSAQCIPAAWIYFPMALGVGREDDGQVKYVQVRCSADIAQELLLNIHRCLWKLSRLWETLWIHWSSGLWSRVWISPLVRLSSPGLHLPPFWGLVSQGHLQWLPNRWSLLVLLRECSVILKHWYIILRIYDFRWSGLSYQSLKSLVGPWLV